MLKLGKMQTLKIARRKEFGAYLEDEEGHAVLLPEKEVPENAQPGDPVTVFLYRDSDDRLISTIRKPLMCVGDVARVQVQDVTGIGAFVDIGLEKDVLLPHREMLRELKKGEFIEVYLYVDHTDRLAATMYTKRHLGAHRVESKEVKKYHYDNDAEMVLNRLTEKFNGHLSYTDKTVEPEQIMQDFGISKAAFKRSIGKLMKEGKVKVTKSSIFRIF